MATPQSLEYQFCDDWFIYAEDAEGNLYYVSTELWPEWIDAAAEKFGLDANTADARAHASVIDQEPNAVERYMLPVARLRWDNLPWRSVSDVEGVA